MFLALPSNSLPIVSKNDDAAKVRNFWVMACEVRFAICEEIPLNAVAFRGMVCRMRGEEREMGGGLGRALPEPFPSPPISPLFPPAGPTIPLRTQ